MKTKLAGLIAAAFFCTNCSVMHFKNGSAPSDNEVREEWHHNAALSLLELSAPVDLTKRCTEGKWSVVTTKVTFLNALAGSVDEAVTAGLTKGFGINLWDPQTVEWECSHQ